MTMDLEVRENNTRIEITGNLLMWHVKLHHIPTGGVVCGSGGNKHRVIKRLMKDLTRKVASAVPLDKGYHPEMSYGFEV